MQHSEHAGLQLHDSSLDSVPEILSGFTVRYRHWAERSLQVSGVQVDSRVKKVNADMLSEKGGNIKGNFNAEYYHVQAVDDKKVK